MQYKHKFKDLQIIITFSYLIVMLNSQIIFISLFEIRLCGAHIV